MNDFEENIKEYLLQFKAKPANHFTCALKNINGSEDGTMVDGVVKIVDRLISEKKKCETTAFFVGSIGTAVAGSIFWIYAKHREKKKHEEECQKIIKTFEKEIALEKSDLIAEKTCSNTDTPIIDG